MKGREGERGSGSTRLLASSRPSSPSPLPPLPLSHLALSLPAALVVAGVVLPLAYLVLRALEADPAELADLVFRSRNARLLGHTLALGAAVLALATLIAVPLAWLVARTDLPARRLFTLLGVLPLAVPGYVTAYALLGATGPTGTLSGLLGATIPRPGPFVGACLALSLYTAPYLFLNLRAALAGLDPALEEAARALGHGRRAVARRVVLPQLRPAYLAGALLVVLHVLGDFGVVSLMRYETFSYAIYLQYAAAYDRVYAACLALMLLGLTGALLALETRLLGPLRLARTGQGAARQKAPSRLGLWRGPAAVWAALVALTSVGLPVVTILDWLGRGDAPFDVAALGAALADSLRAALPAAALAALLALPVAYLGVRRATRSARMVGRVAYLGYATPPLAFALALVFFSLRTAPFLYQTLALLVGAYALHFLPEALGPVRSALLQAPQRLEEAARALGWPPLAAFLSATFPRVRRGLAVGAAFVFLSTLKELPMAFLLSPLGFRTLAMGVWSAAGESLFATAAPYAFVLIVASSALVAVLLREV